MQLEIIELVKLQQPGMNNINNRLNSTLIDNCLQILPDEYMKNCISNKTQFFLSVQLWLM